MYNYKNYILETILLSKYTYNRTLKIDVDNAKRSYIFVWRSIQKHSSRDCALIRHIFYRKNRIKSVFQHLKIMADAVTNAEVALLGNTLPALKKVKNVLPLVKKHRIKPAHPPTAEMVFNAIRILKERSGSSLQAIKKYVSSTYKVDAEKLAPFIKKYLRNAVASGQIVQTKGKGASGSFKLTNRELVAKKAVKPKTAMATTEKRPKSATKTTVAAKKKTVTAKAKLVVKKTAASSADKKSASVKSVKAKLATKSSKSSKQKPTKATKVVAKKPKTPKPKKVAPNKLAAPAPKKAAVSKKN